MNRPVPADAPAAAQPAVRFGRFELRTRERRLLVDGLPAEIGARAFDMLLALVERSGRLVSKDELLDIVWPGLVVEENNLQKQVSTLRKVLGPDVIVTIPGRGYQFVAGAGAGTVANDARAAATPGAAAEPPPNNLPRWLPPLYGRAEELTAVVERIRDYRLVTIAGSGGIGKTRLALAAASWLASTPDTGENAGAKARIGEGAWIIALEALADPALIAGTVARALGIPLASDPARPQDVARALAGRELLLVIDNCEHLLSGAVELVAALLALAPRVRILATSREPLRLTAEQVIRLPSLAVPAPGEREHALDYGAVELFVNRVREVDRRFELTPQNVGAVIDLCRRLDGIALALELAAARVPLLGLAGVLERLDSRLRILTGGARTALARHQTLRAAFDWSYELLSVAERAVFDRLGVFAGSFALSSAQQVAATDGTDSWAVLDHLGALVDKSLVLVDDDAGEARYRLLESGREYALLRLAQSGAEQAVRRRHAEEMAERFGRADQALMRGAPPLPLFATLEPDLNNLRAALQWASGDSGSTPLAIRLAGHALWLWRTAGIGSEGLGWCNLLAPRIDDTVPAAAVARFHLTVGMLDHFSVLPEHAQAIVRAAELYRAVGDPIGLYWAQVKAAVALAKMSRLAEAEELIDAAHAFEPADRAPLLAAQYQMAKAFIEHRAGRTEEARRHHLIHLDLCRRGHDEYGEISALSNLADLEYALGNSAESARLGSQLIASLRTRGRERIADSILINLGAALADLGSLDAAAQALQDGLRLLRSNGAGCRWALDHVAWFAARSGRLEDAARIAGCIDAALAPAGGLRDLSEQLSRNRVARLLDAELGVERAADLARAGAALTEDEAFALGLGRRPAVGANPPPIP
jgi:predicted ATPase/DNA-binding winged helix-turn-helix (wHTH) protein